MIKPETKRLIEAMKDTPYGRALHEYLDDKYSEIKDVTTVPEEGAAIEVAGRKHALKMIRELMSFLGEKKVVDKVLNQYE